MTRTHRIRVISRLDADAATLWAAATNLDGVNAELWPLHMSGPRDVQLDDTVPLGRPLFKSWVTLFRVIPLDLHELALVEVVPGQRFHEHSRSITERSWIHRRSISPLEPSGASVEDDVTFEPRALASLLVRVVSLAFARRHRQLRRRFGGDDPSSVVVEHLAAS